MDRFERWLAISSNLAVLIGIVFLAIEISQNSEITRAQLYQSRAYEGAANITQIADSEYIAPMLAKFGNVDFDQTLFEQLSEVEKVRARYMVQSDIRILDNTMLQCELGFFDDNFCQQTIGAVRQSWDFWNAVLPGGVPHLYQRLHEIIE